MVTHPQRGIDPPPDVWSWNSRVVAIGNNKGGVGKTTLVTNVAGNLAAAGFRVLLLALDTQEGSALVDLGVTSDDRGQGLAEAIISGRPAPVLREVRPRLDLVIDGPMLEDVVADTYHRVGRDEEAYLDLVPNLLAPTLQPLADDYDMVLIDCPPGTRVLVDAAFGVSRWVLIPTASDAGSIRSMGGTAQSFLRAKTSNPSLELLGVLITASPSSANRTRSIAQEGIAAAFGGSAPMFRSTVRWAHSPAVRARAEGLLMGELAELEKATTKTARSDFWARMGKRSAHHQAPAVGRRGWTTDVSGLAADLDSVTKEIVERITASERDGQ